MARQPCIRSKRCIHLHQQLGIGAAIEELLLIGLSRRLRNGPIELCLYLYRKSRVEEKSLAHPYNGSVDVPHAVAWKLARQRAHDRVVPGDGVERRREIVSGASWAPNKSSRSKSRGRDRRKPCASCDSRESSASVCRRRSLRASWSAASA